MKEVRIPVHGHLVNRFYSMNEGLVLFQHLGVQFTSLIWLKKLQTFVLMLIGVV